MLWKTRAITRKDSAQLGKFTRLIYGDMWKRAGDAEYYDWKFYFEGTPRPNAKVATIGTDIVGFQSSCHRRFRFGRKTFWSTELSDAMTHPDYRRQGMWTSITRQVIDDALKREFMPVTGFPNKYAYPGHINKLSMNHFFNLWRLALVLKPPLFLLPRNLPAGLSNTASLVLGCCRKGWLLLGRKTDASIRVKKNCKIGEWADRLWEREAGRSEAGVVKDSRYLHWRFEENPDEYDIYLARELDGNPLGFLITKIRQKEGSGTFGFIADILVPSRQRNVFNRLLLEAEKDFKKAGVMMVDAWITDVPFYFNAFLSFGFFPIKRMPFIIPASQAKILKKKGWGSSRRWLLTMGDSDNV